MSYRKAWKVMHEASMGHMTSYYRHVTEEKGDRESWNCMEGHGSLKERKLYIFTT